MPDCTCTSPFWNTVLATVHIRWSAMSEEVRVFGNSSARRSTDGTRSNGGYGRLPYLFTNHHPHCDRVRSSKPLRRSLLQDERLPLFNEPRAHNKCGSSIQMRHMLNNIAAGLTRLSHRSLGGLIDVAVRSSYAVNKLMLNPLC